MTNEAWQLASQITVAAGILLTAIGGFGAYVFGQRLEGEKQARAAMTGTIAPVTDTLLSASSNKWPQLELGDSGAILRFADKEGEPLFALGKDNHLTIVRRDGQVKVTVGIRDRAGRLVAELVENEWQVNPNNSFDRNYKTDALEVRDSSGTIVLQVRALPDRVRFQAKLYDASGRGVGVGTTHGPQGLGGAIELTGPARPTLQLQIRPMFKYPSALHLGEVVDASGT